MTNLLLKTQTDLFKWLSERERDTGSGQAQTENSEKLQGSIFLPLFQFKVH